MNEGNRTDHSGVVMDVLEREIRRSDRDLSNALSEDAQTDRRLERERLQGDLELVKESAIPVQANTPVTTETTGLEVVSPDMSTDRAIGQTATNAAGIQKDDIAA